MAGAWSVASGMMLRDWFRKDEIKEERIEYANDLEMAENAVLEYPILLGYLADIDKAGYLRASGRARQTFKALNPKDHYLGMLKYSKKGKIYHLNYDYIVLVEDFYFEMKRGVSRERYQMDKYNAMRDFSVRGVTDKSFFEPIKKEKNYEERVKDITEKVMDSNNVITFNIEEDRMVFVPYDEYVAGVRSKKYFYTLPIKKQPTVSPS